MKERPWALLILAVLHFLTPLGSVILNCSFLRIGPMEFFGVLQRESFRDLMEFFLLPMLAGYAIYKMKKWSYPVFVVSILWIAVSNYFVWKASHSLFPLWLLVALYAIDLAMVAYFLAPQVRATYFEPQARWWEHQPRYEIREPATAQAMGRAASCEIADLSVGGVFLRTSELFRIGDCVKLQFTVLGMAYEVNAEVVHQGKGAGGYGLKFVHTPQTLESFERLCKALEILLFPKLEHYGSSWAGFRGWLKRLFKTGHGIVPEVPEAYIHRPRPK